MKRANEIGEGEGSKKIRFGNVSDEGVIILDESEEEEDVVVENGAVDPVKVDGNGSAGLERNEADVENGGRDPTEGEEVANDHNGVDGSNMWAFDTSFNAVFGTEKEQKGLIFDLNLPEYKANATSLEQGCVEYSFDKNKIDVINIPSDSEDEVEIVGCSNGYSEAQKEVELGVPNDNRVDNLSLRLGHCSTNYAVGESSNAGERRYAREEIEKVGVVEEVLLDDDEIYSWLSLKTCSPNDLDLPALNDEPIRPFENAQNVVGDIEQAVEIAERQAAERAERQAAERAERRAEVARRERQRLARSFRQTAREFAIMSHRDQAHGQHSRAAEQLGKSPGPHLDALERAKERISKQKAGHLIEWSCSKEFRDQVFIPSLLDLSLKALAESSEGLVSLGNVPDNLRKRLTDILCDTSKMNTHIMDLLVEGCPTEIRIKNCSWLTDTQFRDTVWKWKTKDLRVLQLDLCGQCMLDFAFGDQLAQSLNDFSSLSILSLTGACRLSDRGIIGLVKSAPALRSINLGQCTLLTSSSINFIADSLGSILRELHIDDCHKINAMLILPALQKFKCLEVLSVARMITVTDHFVRVLVEVCGGTIKELDLANCTELTDSALKAIGANCSGLRSVNLSYLHNLSDVGMEYLANGCGLIEKLKLCRNDFSDETMAAFLESSGESITELLLNNMAKVGPNTAFSLAKRSKKLLSLDISWCRRITEDDLGMIVDNCSSLKLLKVFGCKQITDKFLNGLSNRLVRIIGLELNPLLDNTNLFEPEEMLLRYSSLPA